MYLKKYGVLDRDEKCILLWQYSFMKYKMVFKLQGRVQSPNTLPHYGLQTDFPDNPLPLILTSHPWTRYIIKIIGDPLL
jgi:hypothetical protein